MVSPSVFLQLYYPNPQGMRDLLQALDTESRLELLPSIWKGETHTHTHAHTHAHTHSGTMPLTVCLSVRLRCEDSGS